MRCCPCSRQEDKRQKQFLEREMIKLVFLMWAEMCSLSGKGCDRKKKQWTVLKQTELSNSDFFNHIKN